MRVRCTANTGSALPDAYLRDERLLHASTAFDVEIGREYVVYGIAYVWAMCWYYLDQDVGLDYPLWRPAPLFEVVDDRVSRHWCLTRDATDRSGEATYLVVPPWAREPFFYDRLTDLSPRELAIWRRWRGALREEDFERSGRPWAIRLTYDPAADALYVALPDSGAAPGDTVVDEEGVIVDTDMSNNPRGYEILTARARGVPTATLPDPVKDALHDFLAAGALDSAEPVVRHYD